MKLNYCMHAYQSNLGLEIISRKENRILPSYYYRCIQPNSYPHSKAIFFFLLWFVIYKYRRTREMGKACYQCMKLHAKAYQVHLVNTIAGCLM